MGLRHLRQLSRAGAAERSPNSRNNLHRWRSRAVYRARPLVATLRKGPLYLERIGSTSTPRIGSTSTRNRVPGNPILICSPSADLRAQLEQLGESGYAVISVESATDAISALHTQPFDLIVAEGPAVSGAIVRLPRGTPNQVPLV